VGILNTLEDCGGMGTAQERDVNFLAQIHQKFGGVQNGMSTAKKKKKKGANSPATKDPVRHDNFITPKFGKDRDFIVVHYAGEVRYTVTGFVEKNVKTLSNELKDLGSTSSKDFVLGVFSTYNSSPCGDTMAAAPGRSRSTIRGVSVASQFRTSLQMLVMDLECTQPHYVRCIKPNTTKAPNVFHSGEVLRQLRYAGIMETIRIRREGYALRKEHESFYKRFHLLLSTSEASEGEGIGHLVKVLSKRLSLTDAEWHIGHSKIFLKRDLAAKLETLAHLRVHAAAKVVGKFGRKVARTRAANLLTSWGRLRVILIRKRRRIRASKRIASTYRMFKEKNEYKSILKCVVKLQCLGRRVVALSILKRQRDPYCDLTFAELDVLHKEEISRMEVAVNSKDFQLAADIEKKL
jgi:myosin heavy subunit